MPVLRQLFTDFKKRRNPQDSHSSERPFRGGDNPSGSPLHPSIENAERDPNSSLNSPTSTTFDSKKGAKSEIDSENKSSPTFSITSRFGRMSLTAEQELGAEDCPNAKTNRCSRQSQAKHDSLVTLGNPAMLGYSCEIEGGSPKSAKFKT